MTAIKNASLTYRPVTVGDAELLLGWRADPEISRYMLSEISTDPDRQRDWIRRSNDRHDFVHRIMLVEGRPAGHCSITITDPAAGIGMIGVYIGDRAAPSAVTAFNFIHILNHAFCRLGLHKIVNQILATNGRVIQAQKFNGYRHVGTLGEHVLKGGERLDLHIFEQMARDWLAFRHKFGDWRDLDGALWPPAP